MIRRERSAGTITEGLTTRQIDTPVRAVRVHDSGSAAPCVMFFPDGPNVIEHYEMFTGLLARDVRVVRSDMPGFGFSCPTRLL